MIRNIAIAMHDFVTFKISRVLEPILDDVEYRLALRARAKTQVQQVSRSVVKIQASHAGFLQLPIPPTGIGE